MKIGFGLYSDQISMGFEYNLEFNFDYIWIKFELGFGLEWIWIGFGLSWILIGFGLRIDCSGMQ